MNQTIFIIDTSLAFTAALINLVFAILVLFRTSRSFLFKTFFFGCLTLLVWNLGDFLFFVTSNRSWFYFSLIGSGMAPALMFHITNALVGSQRRALTWIVLAYIFSSLLAFSSPLALFHPAIRQFVDGIAWNIFYLIFLVPFLLASVLMVLEAIRRSPSKEEKGRLRYILVSFLIAASTGITDLLQILKVPIPPLGHLGCVVYSSILTIGVFKHRTAYDILAQMQEKLAFMGEMAAAIAHEIRNPLASIKGAFGLLSKELGDVQLQSVREYYDIINEEIERLNHILLNFQYFTRPLKVDKASVSLNEVVQRTIRLAESAPVNIRIRQDLEEESPRISADASLLKQVILNLIKNAAEACGRDGELEIRTVASSTWARVSFSDNGPGISPENLTRVFEPFFTTKSTGMGMGLPICQRIIQAHGGRLEAKNKLPKGTEFTILLPI